MDNESKNKIIKSTKEGNVKKRSSAKSISKTTGTKANSTKTTSGKNKENADNKPIMKKKLNETVNLEKDFKKEIVAHKDVNADECIYCHKSFEKGYTICPHCHKRQKNNVNIAFFVGCAALLLFVIICVHFVGKYFDTSVNEDDYKLACEVVDYENLVRSPKDYKDKQVKVVGEVIDVSGYDDGLGNAMEITLNVNQFENGSEQLITIDFYDKDYAQGFLTGDIITVYGEYNSINGNIPNIEAKYIVFGQ
jgi:uncharacterized protein (UPF0333 family)